MSNVVDNDVVKKAVYDKLVTRDKYKVPNTGRLVFDQKISIWRRKYWKKE